jgi:hypothetical protein
MARSRGLGMGKSQLLSGNCFSFSNYSPLEAPPSPLSSRPKRTRISYFALPATTTCAALRREPHADHQSHGSP